MKDTEGDTPKHGVTRNLRGERRNLKKIHSNDTVMECEMGNTDFPRYHLLWT
jgi:hypothetical protein